MNTLKLIIVATVLSLILPSCRKGGPWGVKGKGANVSETRTLSGFDKIHLSIDANIIYTQDSVYKVEISAQENILAILKTDVENKTLVFDYRRNVWDHAKIKITIHTPDLKELNISGSGQVNVQNTFSTTALKINVSGSGSIYIPTLKADRLEANMSGNGEIKISGGTIKTEDLTISGFGNINNEDLEAISCVAKISGVGDITVNVKESLDATISGSGDIRYKGQPSVKSNISGTGKVIHID